MLNQVMLVGRIKEILPDTLVVVIPRSYKNAEGIYESDEVAARLSSSIYHNVAEYCKVGDVVGIRGRLETEGTNLLVNTEKLTFLSSSRPETEGGE